MIWDDGMIGDDNSDWDGDEWDDYEHSGLDNIPPFPGHQ